MFRRYSEAEKRFLSGKKTAAELVGPVRRGMSRLAITVGHTDLTHVLLHIAEKIGSCELVVSTWDVAMTHLKLLEAAKSAGLLTRVRWLLDCGFVKRDAPIYATILSLFGRESVREFRNHAKVLLLGNSRWKVAVFTSANLGSNPRQEHYSIVEDRRLYAQLACEWVEPLFAATPKDA